MHYITHFKDRILVTNNSTLRCRRNWKLLPPRWDLTAVSVSMWQGRPSGKLQLSKLWNDMVSLLLLGHANYVVPPPTTSLTFRPFLTFRTFVIRRCEILVGFSCAVRNDTRNFWLTPHRVARNNPRDGGLGRCANCLWRQNFINGLFSCVADATDLLSWLNEPFLLKTVRHTGGCLPWVRQCMPLFFQSLLLNLLHHSPKSLRCRNFSCADPAIECSKAETILVNCAFPILKSSSVVYATLFVLTVCCRFKIQKVASGS